MKIKKVEIRNFRLLRNADLYLEDGTTMVVGRNNSGKTSLAELFRRLLLESSAAFRLEDFSLGAHSCFWSAYELFSAGKEEIEVRALLPEIEIWLTLRYEKDEMNLGPLGDFVVDLDPDCTEARIHVCYQLGDGKVKALLGEIEFVDGAGEEAKKVALFEVLRERLPKLYKCSLAGVDPNDPTNRKPMEWAQLKATIQGDLITAHRGLDDTTHKDNDSLGKILSTLFATAGSDSADAADRKTVAELKAAVKDVQGNIDKSFNGQLTNLLPALDLFGYRLPDPKLRTETTLDVELLLKNHTKIKYSGSGGIHLPEAYNGLGTRNLIYMLLKLFEAYKSYKALTCTPVVHLVFIEEPEAHLHPQMQEVFIQKLNEIARIFVQISGDERPWPVQFVVSTHSSHMANKAPFDAIRYFLVSTDPAAVGFFSSRIRDLKKDFGDKSNKDNEFLHQYMSQTRCDLLFADKVMLIEGTAEHLLLPRMTEKVDAGLVAGAKLGSQYVAILEVGGAYAHIFARLLDFLELPALIITDLDSVTGPNSGTACKVSEGKGTSNACIRDWFGGANVSLAALLDKKPEDKAKGNRRIAYQVPEEGAKPCGRSFEDAFVLANAVKFDVDPKDPEQFAWDYASRQKKSTFALKYAIEDGEWSVPRYITEGLEWLATAGSFVTAAAVILEVIIPNEAADA
ncbi:ATP-dependent endonuclease [Janthinobacterium sp. TB1-E2]|uniref:ATP-dependent endonuclease n=1 Tax=Janthinobacterium aestuarii TaxID=2985511 RepID=A0ABZ2GKL4_9BURK